MVTREDLNNIEGAQQEYTPGYHAGLVLNMGGPVFSVQPEVLLNQYNFRYTLSQGSRSGFAEGTINALEVPVLLKASFGGRTLRFFVNGGAFGTYFLNGRVKGVATLNNLAIDLSGPIEREGFSERFGYGVTGGLGLSVRLGPGNLLLEGRYNYAIDNTQRTSEGETKARLYMASLGYLIPLGGR
ncbi:hypothetical protein GCM10023187_44700 [Nibrella viscosa]|uniref:Outer membrane protein beta-barrel domain-containing protein n=2 Tax=Nibrella viscosa TaxID=1084524 RepID=A0ABP8KRY6_9BACT